MSEGAVFHSPALSPEFAAAFGQVRDPHEGGTIEHWVKGLLNDALRGRASDVHLETRLGEVRIRFRIDGMIHEIASLPPESGVRLLRYFKVHSNLDPSPSLLPEDSHFQFEFEETPVDIRVACVPCIPGDKLALRLLRRSGVRLRLPDLGLEPNALALIERWLGDLSGMFLVTGPVGSGKTTTLYALLAELNLTQRHIVTIEDPVEYQLANLNQIEVNLKRGLTFDVGLRSILRLDPDYILLGEIRDQESAQTAMEAAATGRVVLTTMHSRNAAGAFTALRSLGIPNYEIAASLAFVVGQRLVRKLCTQCRKLESPTEQESRWLSSFGQKIPGKVWHPTGCAHCANTGYFERTGLFEVLPVEERIYDLVLAGEDEHGLRTHLRDAGFRLLLHDALYKAALGLTDLSELTRIGAQTYLDQEHPSPGVF